MTSTDILRHFEIESTTSGVASGGHFLPGTGEAFESLNPATGETLAVARGASSAECERLISTAAAAFREWQLIPPPRRGEIVRQIGVALRREKDALGMLVTLEAGKIRSEGQGEVQEMIDVADFAVGLSRQLYGLTIATERPLHRLFEQFHPHPWRRD